ncbi:MAG: cation:proton antiporter [Hydrogenophilales bacterium]|nr:cation:proton antiporter [Hydrogenophilales bacterium]
MNALASVLVLLGSAVAVVALFRMLKLPSLLAYLFVGVTIGPHGLGWLPESAQTHALAEFGVVFLMFTIGLEFSLAQLKAMQRLVFGLGGAQVVLTTLVVLGMSLSWGLDWRAGLVLGGIIAMSSTAIVGKLLAERVELHSNHGRQTMGVLLFQDLAVVPFLVLIPALARGGDGMFEALAWAALKAALALALILYFGQKLMRRWFHIIARHKMSELFMLNVLLITLGLAYFTQQAELSLALGAFLAGVLISETEYRYQVEADIQPFRDVLLGLFFITVGMQLDFGVLMHQAVWVALLLLGLLAGKMALIFLVARAFRCNTGDALRTGLTLAQAGEFGFVLLAQADKISTLPPVLLQIVLGAMVLSMALAPLLIHYREAIVKKLVAGEWMSQAAKLHEIAVKSFAVQGHVVVCGYGRSGQNLTRFLEREHIPFIALDLDPARVKLAAAAGESVVYGDAARREVLQAAGSSRARAVVVTYADVPSALRVLSAVQAVNSQVPVIVRTVDDAELDKLLKAGAAEVVPEVLEGSLMLASHALILLGVPLARVLRSVREVRENRYSLLKGFFHGATDEPEEAFTEHVEPRLYTVTLTQRAAALGKTLAELDLANLGVSVSAVRRGNIRGVDPTPDTRLQEGDTVVLLGRPAALAAAELRLSGD